MASKRTAILAGGALAGAILLGTAGLALAQDPSPSPSGTPTWGPGMMGGQWGSGMMGNQSGAGMMGGAYGGMMGTLSPDQLEQMDALHDQMLENGTCDPTQMQQFHQQLESGS